MRGAVPLPVIIALILAGAMAISLLFYSSWQKLNHKVEVILKDQFNQQQLMLARKIGDNVESYFDFLENALMGYAGLFQATPPQERELDDVLAERWSRHQRFGLLAIVRYHPDGTGVQVFSTAVTVASGQQPGATGPLSPVGPGPGPPRPPVFEQDLRLPRCPLAGTPGHALPHSALLGRGPGVFRGGGISHRSVLHL